MISHSETVQGMLCLLRQNQPYHPTAMIRRAFGKKHKLQYLPTYAEDYTCRQPLAIKGGHLYVLPQVLHYYRTSDRQVSIAHHAEQQEAAKRVQEDILAYLVAQHEHRDALTQFVGALHLLVEKGLLTHREMREACIRVLQRA